jgi:hypothetical protein
MGLLYNPSGFKRALRYLLKYPPFDDFDVDVDVDVDADVDAVEAEDAKASLSLSLSSSCRFCLSSAMCISRCSRRDVSTALQ